MAHPRNTAGPTERMGDEEGVQVALCDWAAKRAGTTCAELEQEEKETRENPKSPRKVEGRVYVINGRLTQWSIERQVAAAYWTDVWVGAHGAGLTFVQYLRPGGHLVEVVSRDTQYRYMAIMRGIRYSTVGEDKDSVVQHVARIVEILLRG